MVATRPAAQDSRSDLQTYLLSLKRGLSGLPRIETDTDKLLTSLRQSLHKCKDMNPAVYLVRPEVKDLLQQLESQPLRGCFRLSKK